MCSRCEMNFNLPPWTMNYYFGFPLNCTWYNNNAKKKGTEKPLKYISDIWEEIPNGL